MFNIVRTTVAALFAVIATGGYAGDCDKSFNIDPNKKISSIGALLAFPEAEMKPISCEVADRYKKFLFEDAATKINDAAFSELKNYQEYMKKEREYFESSVKKAEANPTRILVDVAVMEYGKFTALVACAAPEPAVSKMACGLNLAIAMLATYDLGNNIGNVQDGLRVAKAGLAAHDALYKTAINEKAAAGITQRNAQVKQMYSNMCIAIKKDCLK